MRLLALVFLLAVSATADILYTQTGSFILNSGTDEAGLVGATATVTFEVVDGSVYFLASGLPAVDVVNPMLTISGSSHALNNTTFALPALLFFPDIGGVAGWLAAVPAGDYPAFTLPDAIPITVQGYTNSTAAGLLVNPGDVVDPSHFAPATSAGYTWITANGSLLQGVTTNAVNLPEPGTFGAAGLALAAWAALRRYSRREP